MFKYLTVFTLFIASISFAKAQTSDNICSTNFSEVHKTLTENFNEKHIFSGVTAFGVPVHLYLGNKSWTMIIETPQGYCTGPAFSGQTFVNNPKTNAVEERYVRR